MIPQKHRKKLKWVLIGVASAWGAVLLIGAALLFYPDKFERAGQFGDLFGIVNALFSGTAMIGVVAAIILQREDIDASLEAQKTSADAQTRQAKVATLAAALDAKRVFVEYLKAQISQGDWKDKRLTDCDAALKRAEKRILEINHTLELELQEILPREGDA